MKQRKRALNLTSVGIVNSTCVFLYRRDTRATNKERWPFPFLRSRRYNFRPRFALKFLHLARFFPRVAFHLRLTRQCRYFSLSLFPPLSFFSSPTPTPFHRRTFSHRKSSRNRATRATRGRRRACERPRGNTVISEVIFCQAMKSRSACRPGQKSSFILTAAHVRISSS